MFSVDDYNPLSLSQFLASLYRFATDGYIGVTYLSPEGVDLHPRAVNQFVPMPLAQTLDFASLHAMNAKGYSCFFRVMVCSKPPEETRESKQGYSYQYQPRGNASHSLYTRVLWSEVDFKDASEDDAKSAIAKLAHYPSMIVRSGGGYHCYWLLRQVVSVAPAVYTGERGKPLQVERDELKRVLKGLSKAIGCADPHVAELARVMRLPDTINTKPERNGARCEVIEACLHTYDYREMEMEYAPLVASPAQVERPLTAIAVEDHYPRWVKDYLSSGAVQGERNDTLNKAAYYYHSIGKSQLEAEQDLGTRARADGLPEDEIKATIESAYAAQVTPRNVRVAYRDRLLKRETK